MPYIDPERRIPLLKGATPSTTGELNYCITILIARYLASKDISYQSFNDVLGAVECVKLELYRRLIAPYEETKLEENGDVY